MTYSLSGALGASVLRLLQSGRPAPEELSPVPDGDFSRLLEHLDGGSAPPRTGGGDRPPASPGAGVAFSVHFFPSEPDDRRPPEDQAAQENALTPPLYGDLVQTPVSEPAEARSTPESDKDENMAPAPDAAPAPPTGASAPPGPPILAHPPAIQPQPLSPDPSASSVTQAGPSGSRPSVAPIRLPPPAEPPPPDPEAPFPAAPPSAPPRAQAAPAPPSAEASRPASAPSARASGREMSLDWRGPAAAPSPAPAAAPERPTERHAAPLSAPSDPTRVASAPEPPQGTFAPGAPASPVSSSSGTIEQAAPLAPATGGDRAAAARALRTELREGRARRAAEPGSAPRREGRADDAPPKPPMLALDGERGATPAEKLSALSPTRFERPSAASPAAPPTPTKIHASEIVTHLPVAVVQTLIALREHASPARVAGPAQRPVATAAPEKPPEPLKILRFEIEPASLGAITVRLRVTQTRVEIRLEAESSKTSALLFDARDHLTSAIGESGMTLESFDVSWSPPSFSPPAAQDNAGAGANERQPRHAGERGFAHEDRQDRRRDQEEAEPGPRRREGPSVVAGPLGVIL